MAKKNFNSRQMDDLLDGLVGNDNEGSAEPSPSVSKKENTVANPDIKLRGKKKKKAVLCTTLDPVLVEKIHGVLAFCREHSQEKKINDVVTAALKKYFDAWEKKYGPINVKQQRSGAPTNILDI